MNHIGAELISRSPSPFTLLRSSFAYCFQNNNTDSTIKTKNKIKRVDIESEREREVLLPENGREREEGRPLSDGKEEKEGERERDVCMYVCMYVCVRSFLSFFFFSLACLLFCIFMCPFLLTRDTNHSPHRKAGSMEANRVFNKKNIELVMWERYFVHLHLFTFTWEPNH